MTRAKLTSEDIDWLERRINAAVGPVAPRPQFVHDAKEALLHEAGQAEYRRPAWLPAAYFMACLAGLMLIVLALRRRGLWR